ncbi:DNA topoisomerase IB [Erythrobacter sp. 3-20A1M]|uniref:DNA topoisomerase IB n=1 Tax=Erythrobacter sp. 3-20A1M TaxID=2653850 RepID=UPI001BFCBF6B|nr:DNA topoisomerase IB [Erythrobacter sp. 3-20A1M]QWC55971.1 DNA topoisomerase IB [Erythrobacter sp. 3-20A1M]
MVSHPSGLIYVDDQLPGITRKRSGKGWSYYDPEGELITDRAERTRLNAIALPPAYTDAWYCPAENGHILATGYDAKGRKQYRYHPVFREARESEKFDGCITFASLLPLIRKRVEEDLAGTHVTRERALAGVVRLLDLGAVRIGNDGYSKRNGSYGATTIKSHHVKVKGQKLDFSYKAKSGKQREITLDDADLARIVREMQDLHGQDLFTFEDGEGGICDVTSSHVNDYLCETMGDHFTAKNFRTWHASVLAFEMIATTKDNLTIKALTEKVAEKLGNTPAVTRKSYIHPAMFALLDRQAEWRRGLRLPRATKWLSRAERGLIEYLETCPPAQDLLAA